MEEKRSAGEPVMKEPFEKEALWFQHWFHFLATNALEEVNLPKLFNEENNPVRLHCVTSLHQQETFPLLYVQKGMARLLNQRLFMDITLLLRTHYEGTSQETYWLNILRSVMEKPYACEKTGTIAHFQRNETKQKVTDKKIREIAID
jgi:hypothetical protein